MDNIYVINYIVNIQLGIGKKAMALFMDLRAAFDSMDKRVLYKATREGWIREGLIERVKEVLTKQRAVKEEKTGKNFWTGRGIKGVSVAIQHNNSKSGRRDGKSKVDRNQVR